jgi:hypothetical protein
MSLDDLRGSFEQHDIRKWSKEELHLALEDALSRLIQARAYEERFALERMEGRTSYLTLEAKKKSAKRKICDCPSCDCQST